MKKTAIFLMVLAMVGIANAAIVHNGEFTVNAEGWISLGGGGVWSSGHSTTGGNPGGYITMTSANNTWNVWYLSNREKLATWGIPAGTTVTFNIDIKEMGLGTNFGAAGLKAESWNSALAVGGENDPGRIHSSGDQLFNPVTSSWATYTYNYTIINGSDEFQFVLLNVNYNGLGQAKYGYDNASIRLLGMQKALFPIPTVGNNGVAPASDVLSWMNPAPLKNPSDIIRCDVWFRSSATPLADPNLVPSQPGAQKIVSNEAINSVDLSALPTPITLQQDYYYYWKVNVIDPNNGGNPIVTNGFTWSFRTGDAPPYNVNAGADKYVWLTMNDGTPTDGKVTFTLTGSYTDDGKSPVTTLWALDAAQTQTDPATVVTITNPNALTTTVTIDNTGWFFFNFTATDTAGAGVDTVNVGVYVDACEAANADPADIPTKYPNGHGDIDGDCDVDLSDFAILAETWIDCMSAKMDCVP
jgi:hypothetical protein